MYDSLDTMLLMGLDNEYNRAMPFIEKTVFTLPDVCAAYHVSRCPLSDQSA